MSATQHPLVSTYLDDLARMLADLPPEERAEVLAGVREHVDAALAGQPVTDADVQRVLAELGPPDAVAREAYDSSAYAVRPPLPVAPVRQRWSDRPWVPVAVAVLQVLGLFLLLATASMQSTYGVTETNGPGGVQRTVDYNAGSTLLAGVVGLFATLPFWIVVALLVGNSRLWTARQKVTHLLLLPAAALVFGGLPEIGWAIAGERGLNVGAIAALVLIVVVGGWLLVRLTRAGRAR